ncbi:MAG: helix-turn-helix transcriptional regulator [Oscillospiraceae bacterium]|jgi:putative transcriptional regulator|nr:helix-turn-helix transcriptional regulator [Oscillospiraceae bacterium]
MSINSRFSILLGERKKRISTVSRETGISRSTLTRLYYGTATFSLDTIAKLCAYFNCGISDLIEIANDEEAQNHE